MPMQNGCSVSNHTICVAGLLGLQRLHRVLTIPPRLSVPRCGRPWALQQAGAYQRGFAPTIFSLDIQDLPIPSTVYATTCDCALVHYACLPARVVVEVFPVVVVRV
ncbi:unnamed protein product [Protopolystoma xenopodis]|uniref:Uncharacterized protein n=1 Tax=Protopolystoma xenopodis TaxID=117903 RepID=A0A3S5BHJ2_9PLAT|nr:unnamed protein product [Protopolystoma xenopodis]